MVDGERHVDAGGAERPELSDMTTDEGLDMLAHQVGAFFDHVPPCHRARVDGRPLAWTAGFLRAPLLMGWLVNGSRSYS